MNDTGNYLTARQAGNELAHLLDRELGRPEGHTDPNTLRLFIKAYWSRVTRYARAIHDDRQEPLKTELPKPDRFAREMDRD